MTDYIIYLSGLSLRLNWSLQRPTPKLIRHVTAMNYLPERVVRHQNLYKYFFHMYVCFHIKLKCKVFNVQVLLQLCVT